MENRDKILSRIRKMLTLANDPGAAEGERDNALRMAHATLAKYNLALSEVKAADGTAPETEPRVQTEGHKAPGHVWVRTVYHAVSKAYFCMYFTIRNPASVSNRFHYFVGRESNAISAREVGSFLCASIQREASRRQRDLGEDGAYHRSFCNAASIQIYRRCEEMMQAGLAAEGKGSGKAPGTAIVLASLYDSERAANEKKLESLGIALSKARARKWNLAGSGYFDGAEYGDKVHIGRSLT